MAGEKSVFKWVWVPISRVIGLQALLDGGLSSANPTFTGTVSLPPTTDVEYDNVTLDALLEAKLRKDITYTTVASSALTLAAFAGGIGIYIEKDANFAFTFADDLKTGQTFSVLVKDTHVSATITASMPTPNYGHTSPAAVTAGKYICVYFSWNATLAKWNILWTGVLGASA